MIDVMKKLQEIAEAGYDNEDIQRGIDAAGKHVFKKKAEPIIETQSEANLSEISLRDLGNKLTGGFIDSTDQQAAQDKAAAAAGKGLTGRNRVVAKRKAGDAALAATPGLTSAFNDAILTKKSGQQTPTFSKGPAKPAAAPAAKAAVAAPAAKPAAAPAAKPAAAPAAKPKVAATAANTKDYAKTMAMQKKLIAQGANIKADGLMGKNTRAAMKAFKNTNPATGGMGPGGAGGVAKPKATTATVVAEADDKEAEHTHDDGTKHAHENGDAEHTHDDDIQEVHEDEIDEAVVEVPVNELAELMQLAGYTDYAEKIEEYANEPDPEYMDAEEQLVGLSGGLNGPKKAYAAAAGGDNAMAQEPQQVRESSFDSFYAKYDKFVKELSQED